MDIINFIINDEEIIVKFSGRIDSNNADAVTSKLDEIVSKPQPVVFDFENLVYLSSAGLRALLRFKKAHNNVEIINVSLEVYDILDMTGFTSVFTVKKAMREVSIEGCKKIGEGYTGKVYRLDSDTIVKVYYRGSTMKEIEDEIKLAKQAFVLGIPTAIAFDIVKVKEGGLGSVFELLKSDSLDELIINNPDKFEEYLLMYQNLLKEILKTTATEGTLPSKKQESLTWVEHMRQYDVFSKEELDKMESMIQAIPESNHVVHGDYHIKNIMMQGDEPIMIDMSTIGQGKPIFEFIAFFLTYCGYPCVDHNNTKDFLGIEYEQGIRLYYDTFNAIFASKSEKEKEEIQNKISLLGFFWLARRCYGWNDPGDEERADYSIKTVKELINKVDSLDFDL